MVSSHVAIGPHQHDSCFLWHLNSRTDGGSSLLRLKYPTPPIIPKPKPMMTGLAHLGHLVIYLLFIALPVIGLVMMYNRGNPWFAFGLTMPYASEANFERVDSLKSWHETLANLGYFVIGLHAAAALAHHYFWKDNTLLRMMPRKRS